MLLLLLLLSCFSRVRLCATPLMAAHQAPPSLGFSRQEHRSELPFPYPVHESEKWKWSRLSCLTLSDSMDCSLPGSSIHGIFQARVLEWVAIAFSIYTHRSLRKLCQYHLPSLRQTNSPWSQHTGLSATSVKCLKQMGWMCCGLSLTTLNIPEETTWTNGVSSMGYSQGGYSR